MAAVATKKAHPDLLKERGKATFPQEVLTNILDGSKENTARRRYIQKLVIEDPVYQHKPTCFMSRPELLENQTKKSCHSVKMMKKYDLNDPTDRRNYVRTVSPNEGWTFDLHYVMFIPTILGQGTQEQQDKWLDQALSYQMLGTYAQTELGHGTFLRGLETTATYDPNTQEFIIDTPTLSSMKWWPGRLGKSTNHAIVLAQLMTRGKSHDLHAFLVQIRDMETFEPMPGITVGDIGPKLGFRATDNGYLRLDKVRIPRDHMLMKHAQVLPDGTYVSKTTNVKATYGTMVLIRAGITGSTGALLQEAATIAIRYSAVRKQSEIKPGSEAHIIDYQTQQYNLFPVIAAAYAFTFTGKVMLDMYFEVQSEVEKGNLESLPELHALTSATKSYTSWTSTRFLEICRFACGGHGYSLASGLPKLYVEMSVACTVEGENTVLMLQTARHLKKFYAKAKNGEKIPGFTSYLNTKLSTRSSIDKNVRLEDLVEAYKHRARQCIEDGMKRNESVGRNHDQYDSWNMSSVLWVKAATAHCHYFIVDTFVKRLSEHPSELKPVMTALCRLYATHGIVENSGEFLKGGYLSAAQLEMVQNATFDLLEEIRPNAVALVDAFDIPDRILDSALGSYDGNVYEKLYEWAKDSTLNQTEVPPGFYKYIKPLQESLKSKL